MRGPDRKRVRIERNLCTQQTDAERKLWFALRDRRLDGFKFVRQEAIGPFIVDFVCREKERPDRFLDRKSTRLNSSHTVISYAVFCLKKKKKKIKLMTAEQ